MNVLAVETSGRVGSVAACRGVEILAEESLQKGTAHGRLLVPVIDRAVKAAGWAGPRDIELIVVSQGPGSFTGLRIGIACAKTLAAQLGKPLVAVCSLDAMAQNAPPASERILTVLDAKRGDVYAAAYERKNGTLHRTAGPSVMTPDEAGALLERPVHVMGDGLVHHADRFPPPEYRHAPEEQWRIRAGTVARLGLGAFQRGGREEPLGLEPIYLRRPEAEERRRGRQTSGGQGRGTNGGFTRRKHTEGRQAHERDIS